MIYKVGDTIVNKRNGLSPFYFKVLAAVLLLQSRRQTVTVRRIAETVKVRCYLYVFQVMRNLRRLGLISFVDNKRGTTVATCRFIRADRIGKEQP